MKYRVRTAKGELPGVFRRAELELLRGRMSEGDAAGAVVMVAGDLSGQWRPLRRVLGEEAGVEPPVQPPVPVPPRAEAGAAAGWGWFFLVVAGVLAVCAAAVETSSAGVHNLAGAHRQHMLALAAGVLGVCGLLCLLLRRRGT